MVADKDKSRTFTPRATKREQEYRVQKLTQLIGLGWSARQLRKYATEEFGVQDRAARRLVDLSYDALVDGMSHLDKRRIAATCLERFENAYRLAASQRNPMAMIQANAQIANIWVRNAPEITINDRSAADAVDPEEDF